MKTTTNVTVYQCDYCKKKLFRKHAMIKHENFCSKKPENWPKCSGCDHLEEYQQSYSYDMNPNSDHGYFKSFRCKAKGIELYPLKVLRKGHIEKFPEQYERAQLMPNECDLFKFDLPF